jgi:hypothetical protein
MKGLYINYRNIYNGCFDDGISFYTLYLFLEESDFSCRPSMHIGNWILRDTWDYQIIINLYYFIDPDFEKEFRREEVENIYKRYKKLKQKKNRNSAERYSISTFITLI